MIREITKNDINSIIKLAAELSMFDQDGLDYIKMTIEAYLNNETDELWYVISEKELIAVIYCAPEVMTSGTWNVQMLLISPTEHGKGHGSALMKHLEEELRTRKQRLMIVETSGLPEFETARAFYPKCGFREEARIKDFYEAGDDKIIYTKALS